MDKPVAWECFQDAAYYDMWCVRHTGERTFGQGFHLIRGEEAQALCDMLNTRPAPEADVEKVALAIVKALQKIEPNVRVDSLSTEEEDSLARAAIAAMGGEAATIAELRAKLDEAEKVWRAPITFAETGSKP
jgi:hypothetical protein